MVLQKIIGIQLKIMVMSCDGKYQLHYRVSTYNEWFDLIRMSILENAIINIEYQKCTKLQIRIRLFSFIELHLEDMMPII